ncbi:MAG: hypothetical protein H3C51_04615 [Rubellimicrobium sp.]|nr:hypothetical protein [Rubellimicrobium sp.]
MNEVTRNTTLVSKDGGFLDVVLDGEVVMTVAVPPGAVRAAPYLDLLPDGATFEVSEGLVAVAPRHRVMVQPYGPGATDSGANPDYQPTSASRLEREMRVTLNRMKAATDRVERRERALASIERIPKAPPAEKVEADKAPDLIEGNPEGANDE